MIPALNCNLYNVVQSLTKVYLQFKISKLGVFVNFAVYFKRVWLDLCISKLI